MGSRLAARLSVALCDDFREERWPSMERVAAALHAELTSGFASTLSVDRVAPTFLRLASRVPLLGGAPAATKIDRFVNRFGRYPVHTRGLRGRYDLFHIVDHSYAHVAHTLPAARTIVTCHDLDAFRSLVAPDQDPRSEPFRIATRRIAAGLRRAARVLCDTGAVRDDLVEARLVDADRTVVVPLGVSEAFFAGADPASRPTPVPADDATVDLLHVGSTANRKRIDVLLRVIKALNCVGEPVRLLRVGDPLTVEQRRLTAQLGVQERIVELGAVDEPVLVALYRRAALVLQPSDREGFGLPVVEALAAGTPVVASDIRVLREVGGSAVTFCAAGDVEGWGGAVAALLRERREYPSAWTRRREAGRQHARRFTWSSFASRIADVYAEVAAAA